MSTKGLMFNLNLVGSRILELIKCGSSEEQIVDVASREFNAHVDTVRKDVTEFLQELKTYKRGKTLAAVAVCLAEAGTPEKAVEISNSIASRDDLASALSHAGRIHAEKREPTTKRGAHGDIAKTRAMGGRNCASVVREPTQTVNVWDYCGHCH